MGWFSTSRQSRTVWWGTSILLGGGDINIDNIQPLHVEPPPLQNPHTNYYLALLPRIVFLPYCLSPRTDASLLHAYTRQLPTRGYLDTYGRYAIPQFHPRWAGAQVFITILCVSKTPDAPAPIEEIPATSIAPWEYSAGLRPPLPPGISLVRRKIS